MKKERNSSVELLRIIAMLFIVISHVCVHNTMDMGTLSFSFNKLVLQWGSLGNLGVDIFVIITGYFMCEKSFSGKRISALFTQVWTYCISIGAIVLIFYAPSRNFGFLKNMLFPTLTNVYWFFTSYVVLVLIAPFINIIIKNITKRQMELAIIAMIVIWGILPIFPATNTSNSPLTDLLTCYFIGAYFKYHPDNIFSRRFVRNLFSIGCLLALMCGAALLGFASTKLGIEKLGQYWQYLYYRSSPLTFGLATGLFAMAVYRKPFSSRLVNVLGSCTFGVYLIHENPYVRSVLWSKVFDIEHLYSSPFFAFYVIGISILVFLACAAIEFVRLKTIAKPINSAMNWLIDRIKRIFVKTSE